ncbi:FMN-dependent NADH-azoreductase [Leucobacter musarum]|uniref:FMN-dependent NADH-azoreductase n=1 Tax=Leucobacter musarum TaxID=1930747 RepID=UPI0006A7AAE1|nr:NAD(P)H-dependent oxidoreductase [Leucobacter musarum]
MPTLLQLDGAIADEASRTRALTRAVADAWTARGDDFAVVHRDLHLDPPPHLAQRAQHWPESLRGGAALAAATQSVQDHLITELLAADAVVIGAPMYNYAMPSTLKAWIDLVHVPGVTSSWADSALPLAGRPVIIATAQGGPLESGVEEFVTKPLAHLFGTAFGMDVHVVGTSRTLAEMIPELGPDWAAADFARARDEASALGASVAAG